MRINIRIEMLTRRSLLLSALPAALAAAPTGMKAGVGRKSITPDGPIWMSGYANRDKPSTGSLHELWAKALAIEDAKGNRSVIVTTDLIGLPGGLSEAVAAEVLKLHDLPRASLLLNSSHTHTGPALRGNLDSMFRGDQEQYRRTQEYSQRVRRDLVAVIGEAISALAPASIAFGQGRANFAVNRREKTANGVKIGVNPDGPVDHSVPVLRVTGSDGGLLALLFGYACHNTTLTGEHYQLSGDYAGFAQAIIEEERPGVTAMFLMLCGGDQNPHPRGTMEAVQQHGKTLAGEVLRTASGKLSPVSGQIRSAFRVIDLPFRPYDRSSLEAQAKDQNSFVRQNALHHLDLLEKRQSRQTIAYPVQAIRFGNSLTVVALGGEVVVDYALRLKDRFPGKEPLVVAAYSNDVMGYIPTRTILAEGGYEAEQSTVYYGFPAPFSKEVEDRVLEAAESVLRRVGRKR